MCHFLKPLKLEVASMMFIEELRRNGGETAATAGNRHLPPNFFWPFPFKEFHLESSVFASVISNFPCCATNEFLFYFKSVWTMMNNTEKRVPDRVGLGIIFKIL